ncbi:hypothetical protein LB561_19930 [Mesorhizobium sp. B292B1B]|uniref:hypothetical protein n=1 Tax=unclassified Mesorhizobium TaxID=325217 RepID=UPI00112EA11C|nr:MULTISPECIES: hypothetical protein [unclassified Mesorhizobium]MCA0015046.1 hypothetical protein [Mesorhizobium sp. B294B1A1]MCA0039550.1 hypothetical protein [Mesorhizobium sp. B292B1B]TPM43600.1 hypothetical protein FJ964_20180 [Mesorhizobium sp. B2-3-2]
MREPSLLPVFGKLGAKGPLAVAIESVPPAGIAPRLREALAAHGGMVLKLSAVAWTVSVLGMVFMLQG